MQYFLKLYSRAFWMVAVLSITACSIDIDEAEPTGPNAVAAQFAQFLQDSYIEDMRLFPATASRRGFHFNDGAWNPMDEPFLNAYRQTLQARLAASDNFDRSELNEAQALSWQLYQSELQRSLASDNFRRHKYPITQFRGPHTAIPAYLINMHSVKSAPDAEFYIQRLERSAQYLDQTGLQMQLAANQGIYLPDWSYPQIIATARNAISGQPFDDGADSAIWADISNKIAKLNLPEQQQAQLLTDAKAAMLEFVKPAYERLIAKCLQLAAQAPALDGVWKMPAGDAFYAERLNYFTTTDLSAEAIHAIGLRELARIHAEMEVIIEQVGFEGSLQEFFKFMRDDPQFYYSDDDAGRQRYLAEATALIETMRERLPEAFGIFPNAALVVKRVEAFREQSAGKAFYQYPAADGSRPGYYYANLYDMKSMPTYQMEALAYHEGIPGHHMQRSITVALKNTPEFQKFTSFTAYTEGWGLYSEMIPKEMGFYTDPYSDFGRLAMELWRAARLVVDTGLHHKRWRREQAIAYLVANTPNSEYDSTKAIERYLVLPGQATAYMIGKLKIVELREKARTELGAQFDIRSFHDEILKDGQVPLYILEAKINRWIDSQQ